MGDLSRRDVRKVREALRATVLQAPPRIGVIGVSGTGKSSTINSMFKTRLEVGHTRATTKKFKATSMQLRMRSGVASDEPVELVVVDAPGLGENIELDPGYLQQYHEQLPACDVILWVLAARNRGMSLDQQYLKELESYRERMIFAINQIDLVHPMNWGRVLPSKEMETNIGDIVTDRASKIASVLDDDIVLVPYSAERGYNLELLFSKMIEAIPETRRFIFAGLKNFSFRDFLPSDVDPPAPGD